MEDTELLRNIRLGDMEGFDQLADTPLARFQLLQQGEAGCLREGTEKGRDTIKIGEL